MNNFEKLTIEIMRSMAEDGTPVTKAEAEEMAKMELSAKSMRRYTATEKSHQKKQVVRKIDPDKLFVIQALDDCLCDIADNVQERKNESEIHFLYNDNSYTVKLIKHRPKKK